MSHNIFADEWRACLLAHYLHVVRTGDQVTEPSLRLVMLEAGFGDDDLAELHVRATMQVDAVGVDFVSDLAILEPSAAAATQTSVAAPEPADDLTSDDAPDIHAEPDAPESDADDANAPQQLSLF